MSLARFVINAQCLEDAYFLGMGLPLDYDDDENTKMLMKHSKLSIFVVIKSGVINSGLPHELTLI